MRPNAFPPSHRLHYTWEYRRFFNHSQVIRLTHCTIFRVPNELGHYRVGITLKARGSSVDRNKVKRQIRETFRNLTPFLGSFDYNVVIPASKKMVHPFPRVLGLSLKEELRNALGVPSTQ